MYDEPAVTHEWEQAGKFSLYHLRVAFQRELIEVAEQPQLLAILTAENRGILLKGSRPAPQ